MCNLLSQLIGITWIAGLLASGTASGAEKTVPIDATRADKPGFLVVIDQPGHYQLSGDLHVPNANTTAIEINADHVTLDLNSHTIQGPTRCSPTPATCSPTGTGNGVHSVNRRDITVKNGAVQGMGHVGIYLEMNSARIDKVTLSGNGNGGAVFFGGSIDDSVVESNGGDGIFGIDLKVRGNVIRDNRSLGLEAYGRSTFRSNKFTGNNSNAAQTNLKSTSGDGNVCNAKVCR